MRAKNSFERKYSFVLIAVLAVCFIVAFSTALIGTTEAAVIENDAIAAAYIAEGTSLNKDSGGVVGSAASIYPDSNRCKTAADFGFPGTGTSTTTWTATDALKTVVPTSGNFQSYRDGGEESLYIDGSANLWKSGSNGLGKNRNQYSVINIKLSDTNGFLQTIMANTMYELDVKVTATCTAYVNQKGIAINADCNCALGIAASEGGLDAKSVGSLTYSSSASAQPSIGGSKTATLDVTMTLTNVKNNVLTLATRNNFKHGTATDADLWTSLSNITFTYTIRKANSTYNASTIKNDGGHPVVATTINSLSTSFNGGKGVVGTGYLPYMTSTAETGWPMYDADLVSELSKKLDSVSNGSGTLQSYTNTKLDNDPTGKAYYKYSQVEYVDTYNYSFDGQTLATLIDVTSAASGGSLAAINKYAGAGDKYPNSVDSNGAISWGTGNADYCSGIKTVKVGDTEINVTGGSAGNYITVDDKQVGYAYVNKINNGRVVVQIYVYSNARITTMVSDYGSGVCSTAINFDGIDTTNPISTAVPSFASDDDVISYGTTISKWVRTSKLSLSVEENFATQDGVEIDDGAPYVWFYTVKKSNTSAGTIGEVQTFSSYAQIKSMGLRPIAVSTFSTFIYNFEDGTAEGIAKGSQISGKVDSTDCTGSGYYRFTFYVCDLAGNLIEGSPVSFYVKVDYETPYSTTTLTTDESVAITNANNGLWAACGEKIQINLLKNNISGNTLQFETGDETCTLVFDSTQIISLNGNAVSGNTVKKTIMGTLNSCEITIQLSSNNSGGSIITISIPSQAIFTWEATFAMYAGVDIAEYQISGPNIEEVVFDKATFISNSVTVGGINFTSPIKVYIDSAKPNIPTAADYESIGYLKSVKDKSALTLDIKGSRTWFTQANMKMDSVLSFDDVVIDTDYAQGLQVYYGVKTISSAASFDSVIGFIDDYKAGTLSFANSDAYKAYFDRTQIYYGSGLSAGDSDITIDFIQKDGSNMRVLVLWAIDQAGNKSSDVSIYYVLADPTIYKVSSKLADNAIVGATAQLSLLNEDEVTSTTFSRGDTITLLYEFDEGYVPYQTKLIGTTTTLLLSNYTSKMAWNIEDAYADLIKMGSIDENTITMTYLFDDATKFSGLDASVVFELAQRKVVGYTVTNTSVRFTGLPTIVPMVYTDSRAEESFVFTFRKDGASVNELTTPTIPNYDGQGNVCDYEVQIAIPIDNPSFVVENVQIVKNKTTGAYEQNVPFIKYTITKGVTTVKATASTSYYREYPSLTYTVTGIDSSVLALLSVTGQLALNVPSVDSSAYNTLKVGSYAIIEAVPFEIQHCIVTFESNYHEILQKIIQVEIANNEKEYGETDGAYDFWVNWTDSGLGVQELTDLLNCGNTLENNYVNEKYYYKYASSLFIAREAGESVGAYKYINNPSAFVLSNSNYAVSIVKMGTYTINKKTIKIDATNQSYMFDSEASAESDTNLQGVKINYSLGKFAQYESIVSDLFDSDKLSLALDLTDKATVKANRVVGGTNDLFGYRYTYNIILTVDPNASDNFTFELSVSPTTMYIDAAKASTVIVKLKDNVRLEMVYGQDFSTMRSRLKFDATTASNYEVSGCGAKYGDNFNSIDWTAVITSSALSQAIAVADYNGYLNVGTYYVECSNAQLKLNSGVVSIASQVVVIPFPIYVVPAVVEIEPSVQLGNEAKTYSSPDSQYGIDIKIKTINGIDAATLDQYGTSAVGGIKESIKGSFVRAIYDKDGNFVAFGSKNDAASNSNGVVLGGTNYYSFAIYQEFTSNNANGNFVVKATIDKTKRLVINPYTITISVNDFKGISKVYDGTDDVIYGTNNKAVDIALKLAVATDDVNVLFLAKYLSLEEGVAAAQKGRKSIKFSAITLDGAQSLNYTLVIKNGEDVAIDLVEGFVIEYLTYKPSYSQDDYIRIKDGSINILRSDFTIQKEYDNLVALTNDDVKIINRTDDNNRGTAMLYGAKANMQITYGAFPDKEVSKNYSMDLELFFPLGLTQQEITDKIIATDTTITVEAAEKDGVWGVRVYLPGMGAEITKRNLDYSDFESVTANNRDYNSTSAITFSYKLKSTAVAAGDEALLKDQYITINGSTKSGDVNVGTYDTTFSSYKIDNAAFNAHYSVDIASLNSNFIGSKKIEVTIDYAKLMPRVDFVSREYAGSTVSSITVIDRYVSTDTSSSMLKTLNYTEELIDELKLFTYVPGVPSYRYSLNGVADGNVQVDDKGNVVLHNVLVSGLTITGPSDKLKNYVVYGGRYNSTTKQYEDVGAVVSGTLIADYEMFNVAGLTKRNLQIFGNDIDVSDKVYDGKKDAYISVKLTGSDAIEEDKQYLAVTATASYARKQVGENINVTVRVSALVLKDAKDTEHANLINNYQLTAFTQKLQRSILARPVGFSVSIKDRVYNGSEAITKDLIKYDLSQMMGDDGNNYSVNTEKGAYYLTKDVNLKYYTEVDEADKYDSTITYYIYDSANDKYVEQAIADEEEFETNRTKLFTKTTTILEKEATAYNPILNNSKEKYINYRLSMVVDLTKEDFSDNSFYAYQDKNGNIAYGTDCLKQTTVSDKFVAGRKYYKLVAGEYQKITLDQSLMDAGYWYIDDDVQYLYYPLNSTDKYITVADYNKLDAGDQATINPSIIGFYIYNKNNVYLLDSNYSGACDHMTDAVSYIQGYGKVTQRQVAVTTVNILQNDHFTKSYDGTTKFYGVKGTDYNFDSNAIANDIATDHLTVENVTAQFKSKNAGLTQVEFTATGITTESPYPDYSYNYSSKSSSSTNKTASILKRPIYAYLNDTTMIYGTTLSNVTVDIKYYLDAACTAENEIIVSEGRWLVKFDSFLSICGIKFASLEEKYQEELKDKKYAKNGDKFEKDVNGEYYMLNELVYDDKGNIESSSITAPVKDIIVSGTRQNVGYVAERFGLKGGSATNFEFKYVYSKNGKNNYSKLEVVKRTLYVVADYREYTREYGKDLASDAVKVRLLNESYKDGIVSGETSQDVYKGTLTVEFRKVSIADIANIANASPVSSISLINQSTAENEGLDGNYYYVAYIVKSEDFSSQNYELKFGSIYYDNSEYKFKYSFEGSTFSTQVPELEIVLPSITGVTIGETELEVTYNKKEQASSLVKGILSGDEVTIDGSNAKDVKIDKDGKVIAYEGEVIVTRTLIANENGVSYKIKASLGNASLLVNKASAGLYANKETIEYDGKDHEVTYTEDKKSYNVTDTGALASASCFTVKYYLNGKEIDKNKESLSEANVYTYKVKFTSPNTNYADEEKSAEFVITPARINVILSSDTRLTQEYVPGTRYSIKYSIEDVMNIGIDLADTYLVFIKNGNEIEDGIFNEAGRYQYQIKLSDSKTNEFGSNIEMKNDIGYLDLTVSQIVSYNSDSKQVAQLELKNQGDSLLVDKFTTRYVSSSNDLAEDDAYWASINQYMAAIEKSIGAGATLTAVVRMNLTYGLNNQSLSSKDAIVTVSLPENVDQSLSGYVVYQTTANGTLVEVKPSDYTLSNGTIAYSTNYLGSLVFVKLGDQGLSTGAKVAIGVCVPAFVLTVAGLVAVTLIKKKKLKAGL